MTQQSINGGSFTPRDKCESNCMCHDMVPHRTKTRSFTCILCGCYVSLKSKKELERIEKLHTQKSLKK